MSDCDAAIRFYELEPELFPALIELVRRGGETVSVPVPAPGTVAIPSVGDVVLTRITFATGAVIEG